MSDEDHRAADAWRTIRVGSAPIVPASATSPRDVIAAAHARLRDMRAEARARATRLVDREVSR